MTDGLLWLAGAFLVAHVVLDLRSMAQAVNHPKDLALTIITLGVLCGHLILDYAN